MHSKQSLHRRIFRGSFTALLVTLSVGTTGTALAASQDATLYFRPHCDQLTEDDTMFGEVPDVEGMVGLENSSCPKFAVEDPQTLQTIPFNVGDILEFDVVVFNPSKQPINHVRSWLAYDTNVLEGVSIDITPNFPLITPGESDFDEMNGYVMIEASNDQEGANAHTTVSVAHVKLRAKIAPPSGTYISFYDIQSGGHSSVTTKENGNDEYILGAEPGGLHVVFNSQEAPPPGDDQNQPQDQLPADNPPAQDTPPGNFPNPDDFFQDMNTPQNTDENQAPETFDAQAPLTDPLENGSSCFENAECQSNNCSGGICIAAEESDQETPPPADRTAFALLQVRNLRATTEGSSVFLAWDTLNSSALKAYNVYYGTTTGRYIQRKTIDGSMKSLVLRSLPLGSTYYFAVRAVSTDEEESAFSQEIAIEVGSPETSTAPLVEDAVVVTENPIGDLTGTGAVSVPGETGVPSTLALLLILCAVIGTVVASRRQFAVTVYRPEHE